MKYILVIALLLLPVVVQAQVDAEDWTPETRLWAIRSVIGEAGFGQLEEHAAIMYVYAERHRVLKRRGWSLLRVVKRYSAAIRLRGRRAHPWVSELDPETLEEPRSWPKRLMWSRYAPKLTGAAANIDLWARGGVSNPCKQAMHYGGRMDDYRAVNARWTRIKCSVPMRNRFYDPRRLVRRLR